MSCNTLSAQPIRLVVTVGNLPEGYCPATFQQFANDFAARLIVTPNQNNSTFVTGSIEPTSNLGPWLKDCLQWFVFNDATGRYQPTLKGGFDNMQYFSSSGTFIVPDNIFKIKITAFGGGGGGFTAGAQASGAGGGGASGIAIRTVAPAQAVGITVGAGGAGGSPGTAGGSTTILGMTAAGGLGGTAVTTGGLGGSATGFDINLTGQAGCADTSGVAASDGCAGGSAAGWGGKGGTPTDNATAVGRNGLAPGGGGSGSINGATTTPGNGADGGCLVEW